MLLLIAYSMRHIFHHMTNNALLGISMMTLRWVIHITLTVFWCLSLRRRILSRSIRKLLLSVGGLLLFWQIVRIIKYDYVIITEPIGRYCWYGFYVAMILVPTIGVFIIDHIGKPEGYHSPGWMKLLFVPAFSLLAVVFTNDLHQLVFTFHEGFRDYNFDYGYGFMYIIVMGWFVVTGLYFVIMLLVKSRVPGSKSFQKLPLMIMLGAIVFWAGYSMKLYTGDLTAMDCIIIILLLESAIQSGLIPSNMHYSELFNQSTIAAQIIDHHHAVHYSSAAAEPLGEQTIQKALTQTVALGDMLLHSQPIAGGHILWQDDVKEINTLTTHLREANELLSEHVDLMKAEVELRERRLQAEEKSRLYDRIATEIAPRLHKVDELLLKSRENPGQADALIAQICVISAYIKRRANLILLGEENPDASSRELESCLRESLDNLKLCGVMTYLDSCCEGSASLSDIVAVYDLFEDVAEALLLNLSAMVVTVSCKSDAIHLRIQAGCKESIEALPAFTLLGDAVRCVIQDEDVIIDATLARGGAQ
ncbi:MAG: hypothetical protein J6M47_07315 [Clostridia bacterium]|nr:hypothetical protein [Clostridia bacterium]